MWFHALFVVLVVRVGAEDVTTTLDDYAVVPDTSRQGSPDGLSDVLEPPGGSKNATGVSLSDLISVQPPEPFNDESGLNNVADKNSTRPSLMSLLGPTDSLDRTNSTDLMVNSTNTLAKDLEISNEGNSTRLKRHFHKKCKIGCGQPQTAQVVPVQVVPVYVVSVPVRVVKQNPCGQGGCHPRPQPQPCCQPPPQPKPCCGGGHSGSYSSSSSYSYSSAWCGQHPCRPNPCSCVNCCKQKPSYGGGYKTISYSISYKYIPTGMKMIGGMVKKGVGLLKKKKKKKWGR